MTPALAKIVRKTADAMNLKDVSAKAERLLALLEKSDRFLQPPREKSYFRKSEISRAVSAAAFAVTAAGLAAAFLIPPIATIAFIVACTSGITALGAWRARDIFYEKMVREYYEPPQPADVRAEANRQKALVVKAAIEQSIAVMLEDAPEEVQKSPRFQKSARQAFNAVSKDQAFDTLVAFNWLVAEAKQKRGFLARA